MIKEQIVNISDLSEGNIDHMFQLMISYYDNIKREKFETDLLKKDKMLLLKNSSDKIIGFSTFLLNSITCENRKIHYLFSGDTVLHHDYWGLANVHKMAGIILKTLLEKKSKHLYWFLICKGYKTYMFLPAMFKKFYPNYSEPLPKYEKEIIDNIAQLHFETVYSNGIIQENADRVIPGFNKIPERKLQNPHIRFFTNVNPGYCDGDELACITKIKVDNLTDLGKRFI